MFFVRPGGRFGGVSEHDFEVNIELVEECLEIDVVHHDDSYHCIQSREAPWARKCALKH